MKEELSIRDSNGTEIDLIYYIVGQYVALPSEISKGEEVDNDYIIKYDLINGKFMKVILMDNNLMLMKV